MTTKFDVPTLRLGSGMHMKNRHPIFLGMRYFYLILVPIGVFLLMFGGNWERILGGLCCLLGPVLFMRKFYWQYRLIHSTKSSPQAGQRLNWVFSRKGIHQESRGKEKKFGWGDFSDVYVGRKGMLLYLQKHQYFIVPKGEFDQEEDFEAVVRLCEKKIKVVR